MTKEKTLKEVCGYGSDDLLEDNDDITISEALEAMQKYADQQTAEKDNEIGELKDKLERKVNELVDTYTDNCSKDKRIRELEDRVKKYEFMIDKGLGWDDMKNDIIMPHEI